MNLRVITLLTLLVVVLPARAQTPPGPPVQQLKAPDVRSSVGFRYINQVIGLSDGRVLVNDASGKAVIMLDARLTTPRVVLDTAPGRATTYLRAYSGLFAGPGDTTMFLDVGAPALGPTGGAAPSLIYIDPAGQLGRIVTPPPVRTTSGMGRPSGGDGTPRLMANQRFIYSETNRRAPPRPTAAQAGQVLTLEDSASLMIVNLTTRTVDTVAQLATGAVATYAFDAAGNARAVSPLAPRAGMPPGPPPPPSRPFIYQDQWAATPDGWIGVLREQEYRMVWIDPTGKVAGNTKLPFPWKPLSDTERQRLADSINAEQVKTEIYQNAHRDSLRLKLIPNPLNLPTSAFPPQRRTDASVIPDYFPPTIQSLRTTLTDLDNNIWIRLSPRSVFGPGVWDVVNRRDGLIARVRVPDGKSLIGLGPNRAVYLIGMDGGNQVLERTTW